KDLETPVSGQIHAQLCLIDAGAWHRLRQVFEQVPGNGLALPVERRYIAVAGLMASLFKGVVDERVEGEHGLAKAPVADPHVEALARIVEGPLVLTQWRKGHCEPRR